MRKMGTQTWLFENKIYVNGASTISGPREKDGPLGHTFDYSYDDLYCGEKNWELAERKLLQHSIDVCLQKAKVTKDQVDLFLSGDLLNQNVTANYVARTLPIPYLCMFGACSTSMETTAVASALVDAKFADYAIAATSSHNATAERQFRYPTEYGAQKPLTATTTVTGAGSSLISRNRSDIRIESATIGKVMDYQIGDPFDLGSAMAPAAYDTIKTHFQDLGRTPEDYDLILTGDLSAVGSPILKDMLKEDGFHVEDIHNDSGSMIYNSEQPVLAGGSGCACSSLVTYGYVFNQLRKGMFNRVFIVATGALMSPVMIQQNETIPTIAHGVVFMREEMSE
ncbi:stage V sporulation protein AD [Melghiribacillus thermohalophilus]|uniref:Stage V sporulation protein AD n=1 Tax=Melghiribacillus thermohalophilus TaxID=1324956 RepID=A0A4R3NEI1_9BACI|nr:stage V sporulation protein AD [Melghiribacillus thermohalophilus]TCT25636.1 stage V sporulation protein AD [Melghiribacillus thermohalophilus]